jgi:hypothetical protein
MIKYLNQNIVAVLVFILLLIAGCKDNPTSSPPSAKFTNDEVLQQSIIGTWYGTFPFGGWTMSSAYKITFFTDSTFIDTTFGFGNMSLSQQNDSLNIICKGKYSIQNGVVEFSYVNFSYWTLSGQPRGFIHGMLPKAVTIVGDSLTLVETNVFTRIDSAQTLLLGLWNSTNWTCMTSSLSSTPEYSGRFQDSFTFIDSSNYKETWSYLDMQTPSLQTWLGTYSFNTYYINLLGSGTVGTMRVEFKSRKMYWFSDSYIIKLKKMN